MGGYIGTYVLALLALLWWSVRTAPHGRAVTILVVGISVVCALMPLSHDLRYYMFWMLTLVSTVLALAHSPLFVRDEQRIQRNVTHGVDQKVITSGEPFQ